MSTGEAEACPECTSDNLQFDALSPWMYLLCCTCGFCIGRRFTISNQESSKAILYATWNRRVPAAATGGDALSMILPCPRCRRLHVDAPEPHKGWTNPPHKSHLCHYCALVWRPADVPTTGVAAITTMGKDDNWKPGQAEPGEGGDDQRLNLVDGLNPPTDENGCPMPRCPECSAYHELVRPGKTQPTCLCEAYRVACEKFDDALGSVEAMRHRAERAEAKVATLQLRTQRHERAKDLGQAVEADVATMNALREERDAAQTDYRALASLVHRAAEIPRTIVTDDEANIAALAALATARVTTLEDRAKDADNDRDAAVRGRDAMREALDNLVATVRGECPAILNADSGGSSFLILMIEAALGDDNPRIAPVPCNAPEGIQGNLESETVERVAVWCDECAATSRATAEGPIAFTIPAHFHGRARAYEECAKKIRAAIAALSDRGARGDA